MNKEVTNQDKDITMEILLEVCKIDSDEKLKVLYIMQGINLFAKER